MKAGKEMLHGDGILKIRWEGRNLRPDCTTFNSCVLGQALNLPAPQFPPL